MKMGAVFEIYMTQVTAKNHAKTFKFLFLIVFTQKSIKTFLRNKNLHFSEIRLQTVNSHLQKKIYFQL